VCAAQAGYREQLSGDQQAEIGQWWQRLADQAGLAGPAPLPVPTGPPESLGQAAQSAPTGQPASLGQAAQSAAAPAPTSQPASLGPAAQSATEVAGPPVCAGLSTSACARTDPAVVAEFDPYTPTSHRPKDSPPADQQVGPAGQAGPDLEIEPKGRDDFVWAYHIMTMDFEEVLANIRRHDENAIREFDHGCGTVQGAFFFVGFDIRTEGWGIVCLHLLRPRVRCLPA
jgi:hypothetical protein